MIIKIKIIESQNVESWIYFKLNTNVSQNKFWGFLNSSWIFSLRINQA